jgi:hypothetical protein
MSTKKKPCCGARSNSDAAVTVSEIAAADKPRTNPKRKSKAAPARTNPKAATAEKAKRKPARKNLSADESSGGSKTPETAAPKGKKSGGTRTPVILQHTALQTYRGLRKEEPDPAKRRSKAFAIATASLQDAGVFTPESRKLTRYGRRIEREHTREDPEVLARKLAAYERMLRAGSFDAAVASGARTNPSAPCEWFVVLRDPKGPLSSLEIDSGWERREDADSRLAIVNLSVGQGVIQLFDGRKPEVSVLPRRTLEGVPPPVSRSNGRRRPRPNGALMPSSPILQKIREAAEKAESYRLHGAHDQAKHLNAEVEHLRLRAEQAGLEQESAKAEHDGRQAARQQGKTPRSNPTTRNPDSKLNRLFNLSRAQALTPSPQHPDFKTLEGRLKRAEADARKHGINPLLIEQAVEEGFMSGKAVAETRQNPRSNPTRRAASSNNAALRDRAKARKFWDGVPDHMRAEVAEAVIEGFDWMDYPDVFEAPPSRAFRAELGRIVDLWEEAGGPLRRNGGARRNPSGHRCPQCREPAKVNLEDDLGECDNCEDDHGNSLRWSLQSRRTPRRLHDEQDEHLALAIREANDARGNGSPRRNGSPPLAVDMLNPHEEQRIRQQLSARKGTHLAGTPFKIGQKVLFGGVPWHVYDHDAVGRASKLVLVSPQGTIARHVDLGKVKPAPATRRNGPPLDTSLPSRSQAVKAKYQELLAKFGPHKKLTYRLDGGRWLLYAPNASDSAIVYVDESMLEELHRVAFVYQEGDYWLVNTTAATPPVPHTNGSRGRRNPPPPPPAHGTRDQVVNVHFKPKNTAELRRFETALKSAVGSARVGIVEGSDFNPVTGSACIHLRGLSAQRLEAAVKPLVRSVAPRAVLTAARRNGEGCAVCPATTPRSNSSQRLTAEHYGEDGSVVWRNEWDDMQTPMQVALGTIGNIKGAVEVKPDSGGGAVTLDRKGRVLARFRYSPDKDDRRALASRANATRRRRNPESPQGLTTHLASTSPNRRGYFMCGERQDPRTTASSYEQATCYYCRLEDSRVRDALPPPPRTNLSRHRRNGEDEDLEEGSRFINIPPEVADLGQGWWSGQGDPLYAVLSRYFAGRYVWDVSGTRTLIEASPDEIQRLHDMAQETLDAYGKPGYNISDDEMVAAQSVLYGALEDIGEGPEA